MGYNFNRVWFVFWILTGACAISESAEAQQPDKYACGGDLGYRKNQATPEDYKKLDKDLAYAEYALSDAQIYRLAGIWQAKVRDANNNEQVAIMEIDATEKQILSENATSLLKVTFKNWGDGRATLNTELGWIMPMVKTILNVNYQGMPGIELRPVNKNTIRYAYNNSCALNFPNPNDIVFTRVISKTTQSRYQGSRDKTQR